MSVSSGNFGKTFWRELKISETYSELVSLSLSQDASFGLVKSSSTNELFSDLKLYSVFPVLFCWITIHGYWLNILNSLSISFSNLEMSSLSKDKAVAISSATLPGVSKSKL